MPDKVFVLTRATSGIGKALAADLARTGETLVMVAREAGRGSTVLQEITRATRNRNIDLQLCDLSILSSVRNLAEILKSKYKKKMCSSTMPAFINEPLGAIDIVGMDERTRRYHTARALARAAGSKRRRSFLLIEAGEGPYRSHGSRHSRFRYR